MLICVTEHVSVRVSQVVTVSVSVSVARITSESVHHWPESVCEFSHFSWSVAVDFTVSFQYGVWVTQSVRGQFQWTALPEWFCVSVHTHTHSLWLWGDCQSACQSVHWDSSQFPDVWCMISQFWQFVSTLTGWSVTHSLTLSDGSVSDLSHQSAYLPGLCLSVAQPTECSGWCLLTVCVHSEYFCQYHCRTECVCQSGVCTDVSMTDQSVLTVRLSTIYILIH